MKFFFLSLFALISFNTVAHSPFDGQEPKHIFPSYVKVKVADGREVVLGRPVSMVNSNDAKACVYPDLADQKVSLNQYYSAFRELNGDKNIVSHIKIDFVDGVAHADGDVFRNGDAHLYGEGHRFVMDENGKFFISEQVNHEGILGGQYVMCAGVVKFDECGKVVYLNSQTGHYHATKFQLQQAVRYLAGIGALAEDAVIMPYGVCDIFSVSEFLSKTYQQLCEFEHVVPTPDMHPSFVACKDFPLEKDINDKIYTKEAKSHTRKIIDILTHKDLLIHINNELINIRFMPHIASRESSESLQQKLDHLKANRPFPDMYDQVLKKEDELRPRAH